MKKHDKISSGIILFILFLLCGIKTYAVNNQSYIWQRISYAEGLSNSRVTTILEDSKGTFWVGTKKGLNRIVGESVYSYSHMEENTNTIPGDLIQQLIEDETGKIWVLCANGLATYNSTQDHFTPIIYEGKPLVVYSARKIKGGLLLGGKDMIYKYTYSDQRLSVFFKFKHNAHFIINNILVLDHSHFLLLSYASGVYMLNTTNNQLTNVYQGKGNNSSWGAIIDSHQQIWIPIFNDGVIKARYQGNGKLSDWQHYYHQNPFYRSLSVLSLLETKAGEILAGTDGGGIWKFDKEQNEFTKMNELEDVYHMPLASVTSLWEDSSKNIWAGTVRTGVIVLKGIAFKNLKVKDNYYVLSTLFTDKYSPGSIWLGLDSGGLMKFDSQKGEFKEIPGTSTKKIVSIVRYSAHELLVSSYDDGLFIVDTETLSLKPFQVSADIFHELFSSQSIVHLVRKKDEIRLLTWSKVYRLNKGKLTCIIEHPKAFSSLLPIHGGEDLSYVISDKKLFDPFSTKRPFEAIYTNDSPIVAACVRAGGDLFIADKFSLKQVRNGQVKVLAALSSMIQYMVCDTNGRIWAFAVDGIYCYDLNKRKMSILDNVSYKNEPIFCQTAICDRYGDIYWGGVGSFSRILHDINIPVINKHSVAPLVLKIDNELISNLKDISIPHDFTGMSLTFSIKGKDVFSNKKEVFILEGENRIILETTNNRLDIYSLPSGKYSLKYASINDKGEYEIKEEVLSFIVKKPWWLSVESFVIYGIIIFTSVYIFIRIQNKKREREFFWSLKEHEKRTSDEKIRFLINISHELRTPLTLIYTPLKDLLTKDFMPEAEIVKLKKTLMQVKNMANLINMVLNARKAEVNGEELNIEETDLNSWTQEICDEFSLELETKKLRLGFNLDPSNPTIYLDQKKCKIVLSNILMNALKYGADGKVIVIKTECKGCSVRLSVIDDGAGIEDEKMESLFNHFYQGKHKVDGYGIGLSYAKMLIEMHHGVINAYNNDHGGATFYFEIPMTLQQSNYPTKTFFKIKPKLDYSSCINSDEFLAKKYTILIVDDEKEIINLIAEKLKPYFKQLYYAEDGQKALEITKNKYPDIIVSDIMMPNMDGYELCREVKTDIEIGHIPVILLTARVDEQSIETGYKMGADNYIDKPFDIETLKAVIFAELSNRELIKNRYKYSTVPIASEELTFSHADEQFISKLNQYIEDKLSDEQLSLEMVSMHMGVSKSLMHNKMKAILDTNLSNYIKNIRIQKSKELLEKSELTLTEIAFECGFSTQGYFSTVFKNSVGMSPLNYRKQSMDKTK